MWRFFLGILIFISTLAYSFFAYSYSDAGRAKKIPDTHQTYKVWRVVDGDTLKLSNDEKVVLIGADAPESILSRKLYNQSRRRGETMHNIQIKGKMAARFMKQLVEGKKVRLRFDKKVRDKRNQLLAYVYLLDDTFVNAEILRQGYAKAAPLKPNVRYQGLFETLEEEAKQNKRGLWQYEV